MCTLALNAIPDERAAIAEMRRVLLPGGLLLLLGHVASHHGVVRVVQRLLENKSVPIAGDYQIRQPVPSLLATGFTIRWQERSRAGIHPTHLRGQTRQAVTRRPRSQAGAYLFATRAATVHCAVCREAAAVAVVVSMRTGIKRLTVRTRSR
jgi:hypothetical protein